MHQAFLYISFAVTTRLRRELFSHFVDDASTRKTFFLLFLSFRIQLQKKNANICRIERDGISVINFDAARLHFLSDIFVAAAAVVA